MSTKIYDGCMLDLPSHDLNQINEFMQSLRAKLIPTAQEEYRRTLAAMLEAAAVFKLSGVRLFQPCDYDAYHDLTGHELIWATQRQSHRLILQNKHSQNMIDYRSDLDMDVSLSILPVDDKLLCIPFCSNRTLMNIIKSQPEILDFAYWNNSDKPDEISDDDWELREDCWNRALPGAGIPAKSGPVFQIIDTYSDATRFDTPVLETLMPYFAKSEDLARVTAKEKLLLQKLDEFTENQTSKSKDMGYYFIARDYVNDHPDEVLAIQNEFAFDIPEYLKT